MNIDKEFERAFRAEFKEILPNTIFQNENGSYSVFGKYRIEPARPGYRVYCYATEVGTFNTTKTALSWCIADKFQAYNTARDILELDIKLGNSEIDFYNVLINNQNSVALGLVDDVKRYSDKAHDYKEKEDELTNVNPEEFSFLN